MRQPLRLLILLFCFLFTGFAIVPVNFASASIVKFKLTGNGGDGLLESNVTPGTGSSGEGGMGFSGITFNTANNILHVHLEWGTGNGFSGDLTGPITLLHLHGPTADPAPDSFSQTGPLLITLSNSLSFNNSPINGGVNDDFFVSDTDVEALMQGRTYINVHTDAFSTGEIRGYLVVPEPGAMWMSTVFCLFAFNRRKR